MIEIDFKVDEEELAEDFEFELEGLDNCFFVLTMFMMPVKIFMEGVDMLNPPNTWIHLPIMNIASNGLMIIKKLKISKKEKYELPEAAGDFLFDLLDENHVKVLFRKKDKIIVKYDELLKAFQQFADKVRKFLWERVPQMNEHPYWGPLASWGKRLNHAPLQNRIQLLKTYVRQLAG